MPERPIEVRLRDPLRELTRKERRNLLALSTVSIGIVWTGLTPTEISNLGIKLTPANQSALLKVLAVANAYFLVAFLIYAVSDWLAGRWALQLAIEEDQPRVMEAMERELQEGVAAVQRSEAAGRVHQARMHVDESLRGQARWITAATTPILAVRNILEFPVPLAWGTYALVSLMKAW